MRKHILIIEDDPLISETLAEFLSSTYTITTVATGLAGVKAIKRGIFDLVILDLNLPDISGKEVCRKSRAAGSTVPILILTGNDEIEEKITSLDFGADDYVLKPFNYSELCARIRALLRRNTEIHQPKIICYKELSLDSKSRIVTVKNKTLLLRRKEFNLLEYLLQNQNHVLTRPMIIHHIWNDADTLVSNIVDVHIQHLRSLIEKPFNISIIKTIHGVGYTVYKN